MAPQGPRPRPRGRRPEPAGWRGWPAAEEHPPSRDPVTLSTSADRVAAGPCHRWPPLEGPEVGPTDAHATPVRGCAAEPPPGPAPRGRIPPPPPPPGARRARARLGPVRGRGGHRL